MTFFVWMKSQLKFENVEFCHSCKNFCYSALCVSSLQFDPMTNIIIVIIKKGINIVEKNNSEFRGWPE